MVILFMGSCVVLGGWAMERGVAVFLNPIVSGPGVAGIAVVGWPLAPLVILSFAWCATWALDVVRRRKAPSK